MHFWIDKRSSQLHNYGGGGRGRPPGAGGFYSRTFGSRHHPPPLLRSSNHAAFRAPNNSSSISSPHPLSLQQAPANSQNFSHPQQQQQLNQNSSSYENSQPFPQNIPNFQCPSSSNISHRSVSLHPIYPSAGHHHHLHLQQSGFTPNHSNNQIPANNSIPPAIQLFEDIGNNCSSRGGVVFRGHTAEGGGLGGGGYPPSRRPRSQIQSSHQIVNSVGRRRSSGSVNSNNGSGINSNNNNNNGGTTSSRRPSAVTNRWSYDPYNLHQHRSSIHHHPTIHMVDRSRSDWSNVPTPTSPENMTGLSSPLSISNSGELHHNHLSSNSIIGPSLNPSSSVNMQPPHTTLIPRELQGSTSTNNSLVDPSWKRTKRIGLTLCFLAFILMSTVAAKFFIEGPGIIDKTPKSERTESAIYFFLTELIFVAFAMALFFTGITCLRKRTNAYLLRQFNQYIMQSSNSNGVHTSGSSVGGEYFDSDSPTGGMNRDSSSDDPSAAMDRINSHVNNSLIANAGLHSHHHAHHHHHPFHHHSHHPHYLPAFDTHVMMNVSALQSSRFSDGYAKPPPYHIALYLPAPDSQQQLSSGGGNKSLSDSAGDDNMKAHRISTGSGSRILGVSGTGMASTTEPEPVSFISSEASFLCEKTDESDEEDDDDDDGDDEGSASGPERKKQKKESIESRPETPPPPYGQL